MSLSDKDMAVIFKADACQYMIAAENFGGMNTAATSLLPHTFFEATQLLLKGVCSRTDGQ
jgi:hypothetical protein